MIRPTSLFHITLAVALGCLLGLFVPELALAADPGAAPAANPLVTLIVQNLWILVMLAAVYVLSKGLNVVGDYVDAKAAAAPQGSLEQKALHLSAVAMHLAAHGVVQVESELRPTIKAVGEDGKISPDEAAKLRAAAADRAMAYARSVLPDLVAAYGESKLLAAVSAAVPTQAALLAGSSRAALEKHDDTVPVPPVPAAA